MSDDFKKIAARAIDEFKADYRARFSPAVMLKASRTKTCSVK